MIKLVSIKQYLYYYQQIFTIKKLVKLDKTPKKINVIIFNNIHINYSQKNSLINF